MTKISILGSGMAGCGAAYSLHQAGVPTTMYDKARQHGGHTASHTFPGGWLFDEGPHVSFTQDQRIQELLAANIDQKFETLDTRVNNYWRGHWIKHPAQCNLYGLPPEVVTPVLLDFIAAQNRPEAPVANYEEWLRASFGDTFAETFPMEYTVKYHTTTAANMNTEWIGPRLYRPKLEEVIRGALMPSSPDVHYIDHFRYPSHGGFAAYLEPFMRMTELKLGHELVRIDPRTRSLHFRHGAVEAYETLVSSIPLPELIPMIDGAPDDVVAAAARLACTEVVIVGQSTQTSFSGFQPSCSALRFTKSTKRRCSSRLASICGAPYTWEVVAMFSCRSRVFTSSSVNPASFPQALTVCRKLCQPIFGRPAWTATGCT